MAKISQEEYVEKLEDMVRDAYSLVINMGIHDHCECFFDEVTSFLDKYQELENLAKDK